MVEVIEPNKNNDTNVSIVEPDFSGDATVVGNVEGIGDINEPTSEPFLPTQNQDFTPRLDVPDEIESNELTQPTAGIAGEQAKQNAKATALKNVQNSVANIGFDAKSNQAFIAGAMAAAGIPHDPARANRMVGLKVGDVLQDLGLESLIPNFGVAPTENGAAFVPPTPDASLDGGFRKNENASGITELGSATDEPKTAEERIADLLRDTDSGDIRDDANKEAGVGTASEKITAAETELQGFRDEITRAEIINQDVLDSLEGQGRGIVSGLIRGQQEKLSRQQQKAMALLKQDFNNALIGVQIANGNYDRARDIAKDIAQDKFDDLERELKALEIEGGIEEREADRLREQLEYERDLGLQGFVHVKDPKDLAGVKEEEIFRDPTTGKIFLRPTESDALSIAEAKALGVPFGTTRSQAMAMGITPSSGSGSGSSSFRLTTGNKSDLLAAGVTSEELSQFSKDVNSIGFKDALANLPAEKVGMVVNSVFTKKQIGLLARQEIAEGVDFDELVDYLEFVGQEIEDFKDEIDESVIANINKMISEDKRESEIRSWLKERGIDEIYNKGVGRFEDKIDAAKGLFGQNLID